MKKTVLGLLVLSTLVISSCSPKAKEPSFKKYKNKVDYDTFMSDKDNVSKSLFGDLNDYDMPEFVTTYDSYGSLETTLTNDPLKINNVTKETLRDVIKSQYDKDNKIVLIDRQRDSEITESKSSLSKETNTGTSIKSISLQFEERNIDGVDSIAAIDKGNKAYYSVGPISNEEGDKLNLQSIATTAYSLGMTFYLAFMMQYGFSDDSVKENKYAFYSDDKVFTITYDDQYRGTVNDNDKPVYEASIDTHEKVQLVYSKNKITLAVKSTQTATNKFLVDFGDNVKDDVERTDTIIYVTSTIEFKQIKLKSIDTTKFSFIEDSSVINELFN